MFDPSAITNLFLPEQWAKHALFWKYQGFPISTNESKRSFIILLVGGIPWYTYPSEKNISQLGLFGLLFPIYGKKNHVPNHQPV